MKKLLTVMMLTLAINFLAIAGGVGWLFKSGKLNHEKVVSIKEIVFPATQPVVESKKEESSPRPTLKLEELLAKQVGRPASEQVDFMRKMFDTQMAELDRRQRELLALQASIDAARKNLADDKTKLAAGQKALDAKQQETARLESDQGFQDALKLYSSMPAKQAKEIFKGLDDATLKRYFQAMDARTATKIIKEFKTPDETQRIQKVLEDMHQAQASAKEQ